MPAHVPPANPSQFPEAASWFLGRLPMSREQWDKLTESAQRKAFMVTGVAHADVLNTVFKEIDRAVAQGISLGEFRKTVGKKLEDQWQGSVANPAWRIETIFRANVQAALNAGRIKQMRDPAVAKVRPFWMFDAILDSSTSLICEPLAKTVLPSSDPWWKTHCPPLHFACRSSIRCLRKSQAEERGITETPPDGVADKGFGLDPDESEWTPDLTRFPPDLRNMVEARLASMKPPTPIDMPAKKRKAG